jgi:hypothetical protein
MSEKKQTNHWLSLAQEIGAEVPEELIESQLSPVDEAEEQEPATEASTPESDEMPELEEETAETAEDAEVVVEPEPKATEAKAPEVETPEPKTTEAETPEPEASGPKPSGSTQPVHWYKLATELGLDVPEPEPGGANWLTNTAAGAFFFIYKENVVFHYSAPQLLYLVCVPAWEDFY